MGLAEEPSATAEDFKIAQTLSDADLRERGEIIFTVHAGSPAQAGAGDHRAQSATGRILRVAAGSTLAGAAVRLREPEVDSGSAKTSRSRTSDANRGEDARFRDAATPRGRSPARWPRQIAGAAGSGDSTSSALLGLASTCWRLTERADTAAGSLCPARSSRAAAAPRRIQARSSSTAESACSIRARSSHAY